MKWGNAEEGVGVKGTTWPMGILGMWKKRERKRAKVSFLSVGWLCGVAVIVSLRDILFNWANTELGKSK